MHGVRSSVSPRLIRLGTALISLGLVIGGVILAQTMNLAACPLCILQRMLYLVLVAEVAIFWPLRHRLLQMLGGLVISATAATGAFIAGYQTWIQRFDNSINCTGNQPWWEQLVNEAGRHLPLLFEATGLCSEAGWTFLQLSIAEWSLLVFTALMFANLWSLRQHRR
jgi:disulfide bond formation protein DsbB